MECITVGTYNIKNSFAVIPLKSQNYKITIFEIEEKSDIDQFLRCSY